MLRAIFQRRAQLAVEVSRLLLACSDRLVAGDPVGAREAFARAREEVRANAAFLTPGTLQALSALERMATPWPPPAAAWERASRYLEVQVARSMSMRGLADPARVFGTREAAAGAAWEQAAGRFLRGRRHRLAAWCLRRAIAADPGRASLHSDLGLALAMAGRHGAACEAYERAIALDLAHPEARSPDWAVTWFNLAKAALRLSEALFRDGDLAGALRAALRAEAAVAAYIETGPVGGLATEAADLTGRVVGQLTEMEKARRIVEGRVLMVEPPAQAEGGSSLVVAILVLTVLGVLGAVFVGTLAAGGERVGLRHESARAFWIAEAGIARAVVQQAGSGGPVAFAGGTFDVALAGDVYTSTGTFGEGERRIRATYVPTPPDGPLDEAASQATATTGCFEDPNAGTVCGGDKKVALKMINDTGADLVISSISMTASRGGIELKKLILGNSLNGWHSTMFLDVASGLSIPFSDEAPNHGDVEDRTIPAGSYALLDTIEFKHDLPAGATTFTVTLAFTSGQSSILTFTVSPPP